MARSFSVVTIDESHWPQVRDVRLEMLADTPLAYVESLATAQTHDDAEWRFRARRSASPGSIGVAAVEAGSDRFVAVMHGATFRGDGRPLLVGVYVAPAYRGRVHGVADALLDRIEEWGRSEGHPELFLQVHESNERAIAFYRRRGYAFTGETEPYPLDESQTELEMKIAL
ncbi:MAG: acetyltransferase [Pseudonocardiales bacterium]|nr:acetyltransferase [Pseudonocardiales bacterium]